MNEPTKPACSPLMIAPTDPQHHFGTKEIEEINEKLKAFRETGCDVVFSGPVNIWQHLDGKWESVTHGLFNK